MNSWPRKVGGKLLSNKRKPRKLRDEKLFSFVTRRKLLGIVFERRIEKSDSFGVVYARKKDDSTNYGYIFLFPVNIFGD